MNFHTFKIFENINGYYCYVVSHIDDPDFVVDIQVSYADEKHDDPINQYFILLGFNNVDCVKCTDISPIQVINRSFGSDPKNMNISDEYKKVLEEMITKLKEKKPRGKKAQVKPQEGAETPQPKPKRAPAKPKAKASKQVVIEQPSTALSFN